MVTRAGDPPGSATRRAARVEIAGTEPLAAPRERYWPELDGLRAVAVVLVIGLHAGLPAVSGGSVGVDVFFTLSGFLITTVLLQEHGKRRTLNLGHFYARRALRLYPALLLALAGAAVLAYAPRNPGWVSGATLEGIPLALSYSMNWFSASGHSYYGLINHMWSLCVEEQFYLVWPVILLLALRRSLRAAVLVAVGLTTVCAALTPALYASGGYARIAFGTDARVPQLLIGALAALAYSIRRPGERARRVLFVSAIGAFAMVAVAAHGMLPESFWAYGGYELFAVGVAALVVHLVDSPAPVFSRVLASRPAVAIGRISYGMYLWHYILIIVLLVYAPSLDPTAMFLVVLPLSAFVALASYRLVEVKFLRLKNRLAA
jgi:peptidoglycan/LPS O-acetylase OafA/YrhL